MSFDRPAFNRRHFLELLAAGMGAGMLPSALAAQAAAAGQPVRGGTLIANVSPEPSAGLVGGINISAPVLPISASIFDGLVTYDRDFKPQPQLAESWEQSADGKTITFRLRRGVTWHDGVPFTSADVQYSILNVVKKTHPRGGSTFAKVTSVDTPDAHTVVLNLSGPSPVIWSALFGTETQIVPKHLYEGTSPLTNPWNSKPIGTGAFVFKEWVRGSHILLERNPNYWDQGKPYLDRVIFKAIPDAGARAVALENGEILLAANNPVPESDVARLAANPSLVVNTEGWQAPAPIFFFDFNWRQERFRDIRVRKAFAHAIDRKALAENVWYGLATVATSPVPSYQKAFHNPDLPQYEYDPKKAEQLLEDAGLKRDANGVRLSITHVTCAPYGPVYVRAGELFRQQLKQIGVEVKLINYDLGTYVRKLFTDYEFDTSSMWYSCYPDPQIGVQRRFWSKNIKPGSPSSNGSGYSSPEMDRAIEAMQEEGDVEKRKAHIFEMQRIAQEDVASITLLELQFYGIYNKRLQGLRAGPLTFYSTLADAWLQS
ncbi:Oligopeptide ABC transporter, periplasmic oligopeptide-binding protein OppA (TC 3.A.1.5.1) [plant metagenome]|uniref:Oligopeptide ABC transporter, periplasmic oligopeptide-binding protein OppA (TC 3.A.1.5.1) n=1 Tax=plant metagenome TaxID=1297885 RepID=A0A484NW24_9ZZZZ